CARRRSRHSSTRPCCEPSLAPPFPSPTQQLASLRKYTECVVTRCKNCCFADGQVRRRPGRRLLSGGPQRTARVGPALLLLRPSPKALSLDLSHRKSGSGDSKDAAGRFWLERRPISFVLQEGLVLVAV